MTENNITISNLDAGNYLYTNSTYFINIIYTSSENIITLTIS
jgi:hypothetical protein